MMMTVLLIMFYGCLFLILYVFALYPIILFCLSKVRPRGNSGPGVGSVPTVTLVIAVYNEEAILPTKLESLRRIDYPEERISFLFGSDGSTDQTVDLLINSGNPRIQVRAFPTRRGKAAVLNDLLPLVESGIVVFSDANTLYDPMAIRNLVQPFTDKGVGAVCGVLKLQGDPGTVGGIGEEQYWDYDNQMKRLEGEINTTVAANGALYAIRKDLFCPLPASKSVSDDIYIPLSILSQGYRMTYCPHALAFERTSSSVEGEFRRRARIVTRNLYTISEFPQLLHPRSGFIAFVLWSRKILRWCVPLLLISVFAASGFLAGESSVPKAALYFQVGFYFLAFVGLTLDKLHRRIGLLGLPYYFVAMNVAILLGLAGFLMSRRLFVWDPVR